MSRAVSHYSSLFTLPSYQKILIILSCLCMLGGGLVIAPLPLSTLNLIFSLSFGIILFITTVFSDFMISRFHAKIDPIFDLRRCSALSAFSWFLWLGFMLAGSITSVIVGSLDPWIKMFFLGFCSVSTLRLLVFSTVSFAGFGEAFVSSILQPAFGAVSFLLLGPALGYSIWARLPHFLALSIPVVMSTIFLFTLLLNRVGETSVGIASLSLFKAFLANWVADLNSPLEEYFEKLGVERNIRVSLLGFQADGEMKAMIVIPSCHRGPFKNTGSSLLPYNIQEAVRTRLRCVVAVPHGLFGHETDLSSQAQNKKVIQAVLDSLHSLSSIGDEATPFVRVERNAASVSCQLFGDCAVLALTLAPATTEDLPRELDSLIAHEAEKVGARHVMAINAHNSIDGTPRQHESAVSLGEAATGSLKKAFLSEKLPLGVGAATIAPTDFSIEDGMGPGGISVIAVRTGLENVAYITIDGNNMVSGLREEILAMLQELGVSGGEVMTTDTHVVNGAVHTARGYYPLGEAIDHRRLIGHIRSALAEALGDVEPVQVLWSTKIVPNVKVVGKKQIEGLCLLAEETLRRAKTLTIVLFPLVGVVLASLILLL